MKFPTISTRAGDCSFGATKRTHDRGDTDRSRLGRFNVRARAMGIFRHRPQSNLGFLRGATGRASASSSPAPTTLAKASFQFIQYLPFVFVPIVAAQRYGTQETLKWSVFSWFLRRTPDSYTARRRADVNWVYFAICLFAASAAHDPNPFFYPGMCLLVALRVALHPPRPHAPRAWMAHVDDRHPVSRLLRAPRPLHVARQSPKCLRPIHCRFPQTRT